MRTDITNAPSPGGEGRARSGAGRPVPREPSANFPPHPAIGRGPPGYSSGGALFSTTVSIAT